MCSQGRTIKSKYRLKLCPFCGAEAELIERLLNILYEGQKDYVVICSNEECHGCRPCTCGSTEEEAVANWNNRQGFDNQADINIVLRKLEYLRETIHIGKKRSVALHYTWQIEKILSELYKRL